MAHAALGGLHAHDHVGLGLLPGTGELLVRRALLGKLGDHPADGLQSLLLGVPVQGHVDAVHAGVGMACPVGVDGIAQALLLPDLLEEAGGHPAAQDGGEGLEGEAPGGVIGQAGEGQDQMILLNGLGCDHERGVVHRLGNLGRLPGLQGGEPAADVLQVFLPEAAAEGDHRVVRPVVPAVEVPEGLPGHGFQGLRGAQNGAGQGVVPKDLREELFRAQVVGGVLVHVDLLQDDAPLGLHRLLGEGGAVDHVPEDVQGLGQVVIQDPAVEAGALLGGKGVHLAADGIGFHGDVSGGTVLSALEEHVLNEVGRTGFLRGLLSGAAPHPDAQGHRPDGIHFFCYDAHPVGKGFHVDHSNILLGDFDS